MLLILMLRVVPFTISVYWLETPKEDSILTVHSEGSKLMVKVLIPVQFSLEVWSPMLSDISVIRSSSLEQEPSMTEL